MSASKRILLLHDDAEQLAQIQQHLTTLRYEVHAGTEPDAALNGGGWLPDLMICNFDLHGCDLGALVEMLHQGNPLLRFIILTPPGRTLDIMRTMRKRVAAFLSQPFSLDELAHSVRSVLNAGTGGANRREHGRYLFTLETQCVLINPFDNTEGRPIPALIRDVSRSGVSIIVRQLLPVPAMLKLIVHLEANMQPTPMLAKSVSCMLTQINGVYRMGLKFIGLLPSQLTVMVRQLGQNPTGQADQDIYMGKSFSDAVRDWLQSHQNEGLLPNKQFNEIAAEVCRVESEHEPDAPHPQPTNEKTNGAADTAAASKEITDLDSTVD